jgi:hypothetical protein
MGSKVGWVASALCGLGFATDAVLSQSAIPLFSHNFHTTIGEGPPVVAVAFLSSCPASKEFQQQWEIAATELGDVGLKLYSVDCELDADVCDIMAIDLHPSLLLFRDGEFAKQYPHQYTSSVITAWLSHEVASTTKTVENMDQIFGAVNAAAAVGRAVVVEVEADGTIGHLRRLAAARLMKHDWVDFVIATEELPHLQPGTITVLSECHSKTEIVQCLLASASGPMPLTGDALPPCCLGWVSQEQLPGDANAEPPLEAKTTMDHALRWLSDWLYDHDVPDCGEITDRNAVRYLNKEPRRLGVLYLPTEACAEAFGDEEEQACRGAWQGYPAAVAALNAGRAAAATLRRTHKVVPNPDGPGPPGAVKRP